MTQARTVLSLEEYAPERFPRERIPDLLGEALWRNYRSQVNVEFPSPKTDGAWQLTAQGWVGHIPLAPGFGFALRPRIELDNLFHMLEYAYRLKSFCFLEGLIDCRSLEEFYERLANVLARRVLERGRRGFYRAYLPEIDYLPYVRGRLDVRQMACKPWDVQLRCRYEEHTADIEENQILLWTLSHIARSGMCTERVLPAVRRAYRALRGLVATRAFSPQDCIGRLYNRLNDDYQPLHALCRFFLEHSGPSHEMGDRTVLPFLVNMARLYELFVAEWLKAHLPSDLSVKAQEKVEIGADEALFFTIDLVLCDAETGDVICVLDTKYKVDERPRAEDVTQVVAYAEVKRCRRAVLIYPQPFAIPLDEQVGSIRVQSMVFSLDGDIEEQGQRFLQQLSAI
jgi:5-methylcytosine-specific restriction enzyme subunit McrC